MNLKLSGWYFLHDRRKFYSDLLKRLHLLTLKSSEYYPECEKFYSILDVKDKIVYDVGCDFGTTPMYFLRKGPFAVFGFSKEKQYFHAFHYIHYKVDEDPLLITLPPIMQSINPRHLVLKSDCEGCEWNFTQEMIEKFGDWIIAVHSPILNHDLFEYILKHGESIGSQPGSEFGIFHKIKEMNQ